MFSFAFIASLLLCFYLPVVIQVGYKTPGVPNVSPINTIYWICAKTQDSGFDIFSFSQLLWCALTQGYLKLCNLHLTNQPKEKKKFAVLLKLSLCHSFHNNRGFFPGFITCPENVCLQLNLSAACLSQDTVCV